MNQEFLRLFLDKTHFPPEAAQFLGQAGEKLAAPSLASQMDSAQALFYSNNFSIEKTQPLIHQMAHEAGISPYTQWMLFLIHAAKQAREDYLAKGIGEDVFWATFEDLKYKALECKEIHGVWGTFVAFWYPIFYSCDIVKLGRLEFESATFHGQPCQACGVSLSPGDAVKNIHIPSSGEPFDLEARLDSYRRAQAFFRGEREDGRLVCVCHSWLLYPGYKDVLPENSNIRSFMDDFTILEVDEGEGFDDAWRVFGPDAQKPPEELPEKTSMQRAFKRHLLNGGETGAALGLLVFDGEKLGR